MNPTSARSIVFLVDDDQFTLCAWQGILQATSYRVESFSSPHAFLQRLTPSDRGCAVVDLRMPGLDGLALQAALRERGLALPLVFVSGADVPAVVTAMKQGAEDFLCKPVAPADLLAAVARALDRDQASAARRAARESAQARWDGLTRREQEICLLVGRGLLNKQIAAELGLAESTLQAQRGRVLKKLEVTCVPDLVALIASLQDPGLPERSA